MSNGSKVLLVTGGARGIGAAAAEVFSQHGYDVSILDILPPAEADEIRQKVQANGARCLYIQCDVADETQVKQAVQQTLAELGTIDVLVNNAGIVLVAAVEDIPYEQFMRVVSVNLGGTFLLCKHVLPVLKAKRGGAIVNMGSVSGHVGQIDH